MFLIKLRAGWNSRPAVMAQAQSASRKAGSGVNPEPTVQSGWKKMENQIFPCVFLSCFAPEVRLQAIFFLEGIS